MSYRAICQAMVLTSLVGLVGCNDTARAKTTILGGRGTSNEFSISDGNLIIRSGKPGVLFGTTQVQGQAEQFSYLIVFKHAGPAANVNQTHNSTTSLTGRKGTANFTLTQNGKTIQTNYATELDDTGKPAGEELKLGGKVVDPAAGRLFLVDLSAPAVTYDQKNTKLPEIKSLQSTSDVENLVNGILEQLKSEIPQDFWK